MLDVGLADAIAAEYQSGGFSKSAVDDVSFPFWRELLGAPPPGSAQEAMYETEVAQIVLSSHNPALLSTARIVGNGGSLGADDRKDAVAALLAEPISAALTAKLRSI